MVTSGTVRICFLFKQVFCIAFLTFFFFWFLLSKGTLIIHSLILAQDYKK